MDIVRWDTEGVMGEISRHGLNVNTATREELTALPGIGPELAARIEAQRPYLSEEDLLEVNGVGPVLLERLKPMLSFHSNIGEVPASEVEPDLHSLDQEEEPAATASGLEGSEVLEKEVDASVSESMGDTPHEKTVVAKTEQPVEKESKPGLESLQAQRPEIPAGERREAAVRTTLSPRQMVQQGFSRGNLIWLLAGTSFASVVAAVLATLLVLVLINGTLRIDRHEGFVQLNREVQVLTGDLDVLGENLTVVSEKLAALEGLSGRMTTVEGRIETIQGQVDQAAADVVEMQSAVDVLHETTSQLSSRVGQFDTFFEGLQNLVGTLFGTPAPEAESSQ